MKHKRIHCIGIGGIGLSGLAQILKARGNFVQGSDAEAGPTVTMLKAQRIPVFIGHDAKYVNGADLVIHSLAIPRTHPELRAARAKKIPVMSYPKALGELSKEYCTIAVCGTHGKTTTTAMLAKLFTANQFDPTVVVGSRMKEFKGKNARTGTSQLLIVEACEYRKAFLHLHPNIIVLTNIEEEHLDVYKNLATLITAFQRFARRTPRDGYIFANLDDENVQEILKDIEKRHFPRYNVFTFGTLYPTSAYQLKGNTVMWQNQRIAELALSVPGDHNKMNALAAFAVAHVIGIAPQKIVRTLKNYQGCARRFELKGKRNGATIIDDYAHHPTEIRATLRAARERFGAKKNILVIFQPHQHSRAKKMLNEFAQAFGDADEVIIPNIYRVRDSEKDARSITAARFVRAIQKYHKRARNGEELEQTAAAVKKNLKRYDIVITMGAGDVWKIAEMLLKKTA